MQDLEIALLQLDLLWEDPKGNIEKAEKLIATLDRPVDLIILPEMFNTGFSMDAKRLAEPVNGPTTNWMLEMANKQNAVVTGSVITKEGESYFNRLIWAKPDGSYAEYDKRHLFRMANEDEHYSGGKSRIIESIKGWKICPLICYDLRFPVWSRNRNMDGNPEYDVLLFVANWPAVRSYPWKSLLVARAIENQVYVIGVNRVGEDGNGIEHTGDSGLIDPKGHWKTPLPVGEEMIKRVILNYTELADFREKFPVMLDADKFSIQE